MVRVRLWLKSRAIKFYKSQASVPNRENLRRMISSEGRSPEEIYLAQGLLPSFDNYTIVISLLGLLDLARERLVVLNISTESYHNI